MGKQLAQPEVRAAIASPLGEVAVRSTDGEGVFVGGHNAHFDL